MAALTLGQMDISRSADASVASRKKRAFTAAAFVCGLLSVASSVGVGLIVLRASPPFRDARANAFIELLLTFVPLAFAAITWLICDTGLPGAPDTLVKGRPFFAQIGFLLTVPVVGLMGNVAIVAAFSIFFGPGNYWDGG